jgi:mycothiol system anti-sigma-R factor
MDEQDEQDGHRSGCAGTPLWFDKSGCREAIDTLYHFLDGELTLQRRQEIAVHLDECAPCLDAFDFEAELKAVIARKCRDQVPEALRQRIRRALSEASGNHPGAERQWE